MKPRVAYCKSHRRELTVKQMKLHKCVQKGCTGLQRYEDHPYWVKRAEHKAVAKERRRRLRGKGDT